jgi:uncharacterized YccA/Bax inhibitor family protein
VEERNNGFVSKPDMSRELTTTLVMKYSSPDLTPIITLSIKQEGLYLGSMDMLLGDFHLQQAASK